MVVPVSSMATRQWWPLPASIPTHEQGTCVVMCVSSDSGSVPFRSKDTPPSAPQTAADSYISISGRASRRARRPLQRGQATSEPHPTLPDRQTPHGAVLQSSPSGQGLPQPRCSRWGRYTDCGWGRGVSCVWDDNHRRLRGGDRDESVHHNHDSVDRCQGRPLSGNRRWPHLRDGPGRQWWPRLLPSAGRPCSGTKNCSCGCPRADRHRSSQ